MIIDCISDLHGEYPVLEGGDLLIVAGDLTASDLPIQRLEFLRWLADQNYRKKVFIAGNHDNSLVGLTFRTTREDSVEYLCDSGTEFVYYPPLSKDCPEGTVLERKKFKIWGSPWTRTFEGMNPHCKAFTCENNEELSQKWELIPRDTDILVTHSPPFTILDKTRRGEQVGCPLLMAHHLHSLRPKLWVWGHIHEAYGQDGPYAWAATKYVNASHVDENYDPVNKPIRIIL